MTVFFYNTILTTYYFLLGLAIHYYLSKHTLNLRKPHIENNPLIGNVNYTTAFSAGVFWLSLDCLAHKNVQKILFRHKSSIINLIVLNSLVVPTRVQQCCCSNNFSDNSTASSGSASNDS
jgi:hypothetical protein